MVRKLLIIAIILIGTGTVHSQIKDPKISRFWWKDVKKYIDEKSNNLFMVFDADSVKNQDLAIINLNQPIKIQRIDITTESALDSPTVFYFQSSSYYDSVLLDSSIAGKYHFSSDTVNFPALPCTLKFNDTVLNSKVKGGGNARIVIQYTNR